MASSAAETFFFFILLPFFLCFPEYPRVLILEEARRSQTCGSSQHLSSGIFLHGH
jgi:hypothetical protein